VKQIKQQVGRLVTKPPCVFRDKSKYNRKEKHKGREDRR
jgi:hypothetical protein